LSRTSSSASAGCAFQFVGQGLQPLRALGPGLAPAIVEGATGGAHGVVDVFFGAGRDLEYLFGGRVDHLR
jgi:hypothetical protein